MYTVIDSFPSNMSARIVHCVEDAVGDDILEDIQRNNLQTRNSVPSRIWDLLNTNIVRELGDDNCTIAKAHRGPWQMLVIYEHTTQCIITLMREKRFLEIQKTQHSRKRMHYVDMLAKQFNVNLHSEQEQLCLYPHSFADEEKREELVGSFLGTLIENVDIIQNHILVLFETSGYQLVHIRAVMVTPDLTIAEESEQDWTKYLSANASSIVEKTSASNTLSNHPDRHLSLTGKALSRREAKLKIKKESQDSKGN